MGENKLTSLDAHIDATPERVQRFVEEFAERYPAARITTSAVVMIALAELHQRGLIEYTSQEEQSQ